MYWLAPIVADAEAGFGGTLNAFELMKAMIEAGAAACILKINFRRRRSADTSAERFWCQPRRLSRSWSPPAWLPTSGCADAYHGPHRRQQRHLLTSDIDPRDRHS